MKSLKRQAGVSLLEGLIAMAIFAVAVLGLLALQTNLLRESAQSQYRVEASLLGSSMAGLIGTDTGNTGCYAVNTTSAMGCASADSTAAAERWRQEVVVRLPNTQALPVASMPNPTVAIAADGTATVTVKWQPPKDTAVRNFITIAQPLQ
jgi:Tfp pilus assembly protein PilV